MNILFALIPISLILLGIAVAAFVWAVRRGQFDDMDTPALDILREDPNEAPAQAPRPPGDGEAPASATDAD